MLQRVSFLTRSLFLAAAVALVSGCEDSDDKADMNISGWWDLSGPGLAGAVEFVQSGDDVHASLDSGGCWWEFTGYFVDGNTVNGWASTTCKTKWETVCFTMTGDEMRGTWGDGVEGAAFRGVRRAVAVP